MARFIKDNFWETVVHIFAFAIVLCGIILWLFIATALYRVGQK